MYDTWMNRSKLALFAQVNHWDILRVGERNRTEDLMGFQILHFAKLIHFTKILHDTWRRLKSASNVIRIAYNFCRCLSKSSEIVLIIEHCLVRESGLIRLQHEINLLRINRIFISLIFLLFLAFFKSRLKTNF